MAFSNLQGHNFMNLTTFRKNGETVPTPVWFAQVGDTLYVYTQHHLGKVKRIRNNEQVTVAPCTARGEILGETVNARARVLTSDAPEAKIADSTLNQKYGLQKRLFMLMSLVMRLFSRKDTQRVYLEIKPL
jgi:uncharacterized protein